MTRTSSLRMVLVGLGMLVLPALAGAQTLRLASWNLEWMVSPQTSRSARMACIDGAKPTLPCDVALDQTRSSADYAALADYAKQLNADVVAIQEVEDQDTAARVLPGYRFCMTASRAPQNVGFAIRSGLAHRCEPDYLPLALGGRLRRGAVLTLFPGTPRETRLMAVHLKSGCARERRKPNVAACSQWQQQLPLLTQWISAQTGRYAVLGDFNRELAAGDPQGLLNALHHAAGGALADAAGSTRFVNCWPGQSNASGIDHILLGGGLQALMVAGSYQRQGYRSSDVRRYRLSDHCPVSVQLRY
jgi:endonuclease/exonuclease/phosphatase family metal-dependent hydrolase